MINKFNLFSSSAPGGGGGSLPLEAVPDAREKNA